MSLRAPSSSDCVVECTELIGKLAKQGPFDGYGVDCARRESASCPHVRVLELEDFDIGPICSMLFESVRAGHRSLMASYHSCAVGYYTKNDRHIATGLVAREGNFPKEIGGIVRDAMQRALSGWMICDDPEEESVYERPKDPSGYRLFMKPNDQAPGKEVFSSQDILVRALITRYRLGKGNLCHKTWIGHKNWPQSGRIYMWVKDPAPLIAFGFEFNGGMEDSQECKGPPEMSNSSLDS